MNQSGVLSLVLGYILVTFTVVSTNKGNRRSRAHGKTIPLTTITIVINMLYH